MVLNSKFKNWRKARLEEVLTLVIDHRGKTPKKLGGNWSSEGIPAISAKNIKGGTLVDELGIRCVGIDLYEKWMPEKLDAGDILLTSEAPLGELFYLREKVDYCLSQRLFALRADTDKLNSKYLYYFLLSPKGQHELKRRISGTAAEGIRQSELVQIEVILPSLEEQKRIAAILSAFDDKIELNNKTNQTLEKTAQAIFREWFVNFRFPGCEKAEFVESGSGEIPKGWEIKKLGNILTLEYGKGLTQNQRNKGKFPVYGSSGIVGYHDKKLVGGPGIIIGRAGIPGSVYWSQSDFFCVDSTFYVNSNISNYFLFYLLKRQNLGSLISGSAVPGINRNLIYLNRVIIPDSLIIKKFEGIVTPIFEKKYKNINENQKLTSLRNFLLPRLMSGEIKA